MTSDFEAKIWAWVQAFIESLKGPTARKWQKGVDTTTMSLEGQFDLFMAEQSIPTQAAQTDELARELAKQFMTTIIFEPLEKAVELQDEFAELFSEWLDAQSSG